MKCGSWPLGRIEQVHPGQDGIICVVNVCTKTWVHMRPVVKTCQLEECYVDKVHQGGGNVTESTSDSRIVINYRVTCW